VTPSLLLDEYRFRSLDDGTALYGVVGSPIAHSVSPAMHNAAFAETGLNAVYMPFRAADVDDFMSFARTFDLKGASVTIPHKVAICGRMDATSDLARRIGAINAVRLIDGRWHGDNTDANGFLEPLADAALHGTRASILGAGGAARGVAIALASRGAIVTVHGRNRERAAEVAALISGSVGRWPPERGSWDLLVNCTPIGMHPHVEDTPLDRSELGAGTVYDIVYNPPKTRLLREAEEAGCRTIGGLEMLVGQARQAFEWWTGVRPSAAVMRRAALERVMRFEAAHDKSRNDATPESAGALST
jgi:shikimate dehydrogenase